MEEEEGVSGIPQGEGKMVLLPAWMVVGDTLALGETQLLCRTMIHLRRIIARGGVVADFLVITAFQFETKLFWETFTAI